jgi:hypothetical protein
MREVNTGIKQILIEVRTLFEGKAVKRSVYVALFIYGFLTTLSVAETT